MNSCAGQPTTEAPLLAARNVSKFFPGVRALDGIDFTLRRGEVHALMGENGAGKSTLVKIMAGLFLADQGAVRINGQQVLFRSTAQAQYAGVSVIYQEPTLFRVADTFEKATPFRDRRPALVGG